MNVTRCLGVSNELDGGALSEGRTRTRHVTGPSAFQRTLAATAAAQNDEKDTYDELVVKKIGRDKDGF